MGFARTACLFLACVSYHGIHTEAQLMYRVIYIIILLCMSLWIVATQLCHFFLLLVLRISTHLHNSIILIVWEEERLFSADSVYIVLTLSVDLLYASSFTVELQITTKPAGHIFRRLSTDPHPLTISWSPTTSLSQ